MDTKFSYSYDLNGVITACGYQNFDNELDGSEPFTGFDCINWRKDIATNTWASLIIDYKYLIVPTDLIPALAQNVGLVEDILVGQEFTVYLDDISLTNRNGEERNPRTLPVTFTPCTVLEWDEGDDIIIQGIIDQFNLLYDPPRHIDFSLKFENKAELDTFILNNV